MSVRKDTIYNLAGNGLPLIAAAFSIPYYYRVYGPAGFGVITLIWSIIGYSGIFDLGVGRALTYYISRDRNANNSICLEHKYVISGVIISVFSGVLGTILLYLFSGNVVGLLKLDASLKIDTISAFQISALGIPLTTLSSSFRGILEGRLNFRTSALFRILFGVATFLAPALAIQMSGKSIYWAAESLVILRLLLTTLMVFSVFERMAFQSWSEGLVDRIVEIFSYSLWLTVSSIIGPLMIYGDRFIIGWVIGVTSLPFYAIPQEAIQRILLIPLSLASALYPRMSGVDEERMQFMYKAHQRKVFIIMVIICAFSMMFSYPVLALWLSADFANKSILITIVLLVGVLINSMSQIPYVGLHAQGRSYTTAKIHSIELLFYLPSLFIALHLFGIVGAAYVWVVRAVVDYLLLDFCLKKNWRWVYDNRT